MKITMSIDGMFKQSALATTTEQSPRVKQASTCAEEKTASVGSQQRRTPQPTTMHFDELFPVMGGMGRYQFFLLVLGALVSVWSVEVLTTTFIAAGLDHWCSVPALQRLPPSRQRYLAIPRHKNVYKHCHRFDFNYSGFSEGELEVWNRTARVGDDEVGYTACDAGWTYNFSSYESSAVNRVREKSNS